MAENPREYGLMGDYPTWNKILSSKMNSARRFLRERNAQKINGRLVAPTFPVDPITGKPNQELLAELEVKEKND